MFNSENKYLETNLNKLIENKESYNIIDNETLNLIISSYLEVNRTYTNSKPQIQTIIINKNEIIIKGCEEVQSFKINDFITYFKTEVLPNMDNTDFIQFLKLLGGL